ncbi:unnamed protein product [Adineta steineri]|uniref:Uncharacterized protein n=1 Tax=Adineta steineri TaxID=433720 RepID=A0A813WKL6_9BILA|nr:unnamed protein product [Adineta steineri]CAF3982364.1 unnamed protein product [Adineta steineri]
MSGKIIKFYFFYNGIIFQLAYLHSYAHFIPISTDQCCNIIKQKVLMSSINVLSNWDVDEKKTPIRISDNFKKHWQALLIGLTIGALCSGIALAAVTTLLVQVPLSQHIQLVQQQAQLPQVLRARQQAQLQQVLRQQVLRQQVRRQQVRRQQARLQQVLQLQPQQQHL